MMGRSLAAAIALAMSGAGLYDRLWIEGMAQPAKHTANRPHKVSRTNSHKQNARRKKGGKP